MDMSAKLSPSVRGSPALKQGRFGGAKRLPEVDGGVAEEGADGGAGGVGEYENRFTVEWKAFLAETGQTEQRQLPIIGGQHVNIFRLYQEIANRSSPIQSIWSQDVW